jgi:subfamily B ATP-binding cassette protein MsbA
MSRPSPEAAGEAGAYVGAIRTLLAFLRPYPWVLPTVALLGVVASLAEGIGISLLIPFLALLMEGGLASTGLVAELTARYAVLFDEDVRLIMMSATIVLLVVGVCLFHFGYIRVLTWAATRVSHDLRTRLFRQFLGADDLFVERGAQGRQLNALDGGSYRVGQAIVSLCLMMVNGCTAFVLVALMALISWPMTVVILAGVAVAGVIVRLGSARCVASGRSVEANGGLLNETAIQAFGGIRTIRMFGQEACEAAAFESASERLRRAQYGLEFAWRSMGPLIDLLSVPLLIGALVIAWQASISLAILFPFLFLVFRLQRYAREFDVARVRLGSTAMAVLEIKGELDRTAGPGVVSGRRPFTRLTDRIVFDRVGLTRGVAGPGRTALSDVSLEIRRGETVAIVGESGAGKSTLINVLCRIYDPTSGQITVDRVPLTDLDLWSWRRAIGFAGQDADLRPSTIRENIAYGNPAAGRAEVAKAAGQAGIRGFIEALPDGYETPVGVRGMQLSGGERQRIALARALLRKPQILILDEATNAVDNVAEAEIQRALGRLAGTLTTIIVAHRLTSTRQAGRIIVMQDGRVIDSGARSDLLERRGFFSQLHGIEAGSAVD